MLKLEDVRKSRIWQEAKEEGREEGREEMKLRTVSLLVSLGLDQATIARKLGLSEEAVAEAAAKYPLPE